MVHCRRIFLVATMAVACNQADDARSDAQRESDADDDDHGKDKDSDNNSDSTGYDPADPDKPPVPAHQGIQAYNGPETCIACHEGEAHDALSSIHMQWSGPTIELTNTDGESLGKAEEGINTFCTYAMSSESACFGCHVRADGNAPHAPQLGDVDCLMCHSDVYQRTFTKDPNETVTVTNVLGEEKTYVFGAKDELGNFLTEPDFAKMPPGTTMVDVARNVHMPTRKSCLRCHGTAGGGDWTKRGDMGLSTASPAYDEDIHMSPEGGDLTCVSCHGGTGHKIGGRGIDLRSTEAPDPTCIGACHSETPHDQGRLNRHAKGQLSCQTCHIRAFAKGGQTEMSRDWLDPHWNEKFCSGQGGFVGHEVKASNVPPEYRWFDGTSEVYNLGEVAQPNPDGTYTMARANGAAFDGASKIVPIKDHWTVMPLHDESGEFIPPVIMWMFMTGDFDLAVQLGMQERGMTGSYSIVDANAEMLITHGVDPADDAPGCSDCHDGSGRTPDGAGMLPLAELGFHTFPAKVDDCSLCHEPKQMNWEQMHDKHREKLHDDCTACHTSEPTGFVEPFGGLCDNCHSGSKANKYFEGEMSSRKLHDEHLEGEGDQPISCSACHTF